ncbi:MAG: secD, partial [Acidimicrobiaceae bacterium]
MQRKLLGTLIGILVIAFGGLTATLIAGNSPSLGLDLQGGISVTQQPVGDYDPAVLDLAVERIRDRVDSLGVAEPEIIRQGDAIVVNLPGVKNQQEAIELVQVTGQVYLRPVEGCLGEGVPTPTTDPVATTTTGTPTTTAPAASTTTAGAPTTTAAGGPSRRVSSTPTTDPGATTPPDATAPDTSVPASGTTIAGDPVPAASVPATSVPVDAVPVDAQAP